MSMLPSRDLDRKNWCRTRAHVFEHMWERLLSIVQRVVTASAEDQLSRQGSLSVFRNVDMAQH